MLENEGVALRAVRWSEIFPWLSIVKGVRLAMTMQLLAFGAVAVLLTLVGWWQIARVFSHAEVAEMEGDNVTRSVLNGSWRGPFQDQSPWQVIDHTVPNRPFADVLPSAWNPVNLDSAENPGVDRRGMEIRERGGPLLYGWALLSRPVWRLLSIHSPASRESATVGDWFSLFFSALWSLAVWSYFGAAISRVAAVQLATGEHVGWGAALRWARAKWLSYFLSPVLPMAGVVVVAAPILVLGFFMRWSFPAILVALIWPLALIGGLVMAVLLVGVLLGWPLMWATISVEGTDTFDALNRTYAYVFQRPLRYLFYVVVSALGGWLGWFVVEYFAALVIWLASWAAAWGTGAEHLRDRGLDHRVLGRVGQTAGHRLLFQLPRCCGDGDLLSAAARC